MTRQSENYHAANIQTIREHIRNLMESAYNTKYHYSIISNTRNYDIKDWPKHAQFTPAD